MMYKNGNTYYIPVTIDNITEEGNMTRVITKEGTAFYLTESEMEEAIKVYDNRILWEACMKKELP